MPIPGPQGIQGPTGITGPAGAGAPGRDGDDGTDGVGSGGTAGYGTIGTIAKWIQNSQIGDSVLLESAGFIGIGATPAQIFHTTSAVNANSIILAQNTNAAGNAASAAVRAQGDTAVATMSGHGTGKTTTRYGVTTGGYGEFLVSAGNGMLFGTSIAGPIIVGTNNVERARWLSTGQLGLGIVTPGFDVEIQQTGGNPGCNVAAVSGSNFRATRGFGVNAAVTAGWIMGQSFGANTTRDFYMYDLVNSRQALGIGASAGAWIITGQGTSALPHKFTTGATGRQQLFIEQTADGATMIADVRIGANSSNVYLQAFPPSFGSSGSAQASGARLYADSSAGLYIEANAGPINFWANGAQAARLFSSGGFSIGNTTDIAMSGLLTTRLGGGYVTGTLAAGNNNNVDPGAALFFVITNAGAGSTATLTGLTGGWTGRLLWLINESANGVADDITVSLHDTNSSAANRMDTIPGIGSTAPSVTLTSRGRILFFYDGSTWCILD